MNSFCIPKEQTETVNQRTDNTMVKRRKRKTREKHTQKQLKIEQH